MVAPQPPNRLQGIPITDFVAQLRVIAERGDQPATIDLLREAHASARSEAQRGQLGLGCNDVVDTAWGVRADQGGK